MSVRVVGKLTFTLMLSLWLLSIVALSQPLVRVDRTTVAEGDSVTLRIRSHDPDATLTTRPLARNFRIVDRRSETNNPALEPPGSTYQEWVLSLVPRRTGTLTIPSLTVGSESTRPMTVRVLPVSAEQQQFRNRLIESEATIARSGLYVDETTAVTLTLYYNVNIEGEFRDFQPDASQWDPVGNAETGTTEWNDGRRVNYHRFRYLFTPLQSGPGRLPSIDFEGTYRTHGFSAPRPVAVRTDAIPLDIKPIPASFPDSASWLPARQVSLEESWTETPRNLAPGARIERTITLRASGPTADRLPVISAESPDAQSLAVFADTPERTEARSQAGYDSSVTVSLVYRNISQQDRSVSIPALEIPWWNTETDSLETARLPARALSLESPGTRGAVTGTPPPGSAPAADSGRSFGWVHVLLLLIGIGLGSLLVRRWLRRSREAAARRLCAPTHPVATTRQSGQTDWKQAARPLVENADWSSLERALAHWWQPFGWPDADAIEHRLGQPGVARALNATRARLYARPGARPSDEDLRALWEAAFKQTR